MFLAREISINQQDDKELLERCRNGEQQAFTEVVRRYKAKVASTVFGMLGRGDHAEDIGQEVFIRFFNAIGTFRGESSIGTYITRIAINLSLNEIKRRKLRRILSFEALADEGIEIADPGNYDTLNDNKEIIQQAILKLKVKYRSVLILRLIDDYSTEETANILNVPVGTVLSRLARAQMKLREYLKPYRSEL